MTFIFDSFPAENLFDNMVFNSLPLGTLFESIAFDSCLLESLIEIIIFNHSSFENLFENIVLWITCLYHCLLDFVFENVLSHPCWNVIFRWSMGINHLEIMFVSLLMKLIFSLLSFDRFC